MLERFAQDRLTPDTVGELCLDPRQGGVRCQGLAQRLPAWPPALVGLTIPRMAARYQRSSYRSALIAIAPRTNPVSRSAAAAEKALNRETELPISHS